MGATARPPAGEPRNANHRRQPNKGAAGRSTRLQPPGPFKRGTGQYMSWMKIMAAWAVFLLWVGTTDWVSRDCQEMKLQYLRWNPSFSGFSSASIVLMWLLPWFWLGFPMLIIAYVAPLATYIVYRNGQVDSNRNGYLHRPTSVSGFRNGSPAWNPRRNRPGKKGRP